MYKFPDTEAGDRAKTLYRDLELNFVTDFVHANDDNKYEIVLDGTIESYNDLDTWFAVVVTSDKYTVVTVYGDIRNETCFKYEWQVIEHLCNIKDGEEA